MHTYFSDDCEESIDNIAQQAIEIGLDEICITDHVDYGVKLDKEDWELSDKSMMMNVDYANYFPYLMRAQEKYKDRLKIKIGLEFGMQTHTIDNFQKLFDASPLDFVILSCHQVEDKEFWTGAFQKGLNQRDYNRKYYEEILNLIRNYKDYSVLGHLDLIQRYNDVIEPIENHIEIIEEILKQVIKDDKGIEINTSSERYGLKDLTPAYDILKLYYDLGGKIITVGSDAHKASDVGDRIQFSYDILRKIGFKKITTFEKMQPIQNSL